MKTPKKPIGLIILDGFGYSDPGSGSPITPQTMPFFFSLLARYPWTTLAASGTAVGLPPGTPGNSAVGHFTLGSGRAIEQPLTEFSRLIHEHKLCSLAVIKKNFTMLAQSGKTLHILGLMSDGGAHSKLEFTTAIIACARRYGITSINVHAILDGRDVPQKSAPQFLEKIDAPVVTIQGRIYAMDRNQDKERLQRGYSVLVNDLNQPEQTWQNALETYYKQGFYDETIPPTQLSTRASIKPGDGIVFVNIRADRDREIYESLKNTHDLSFIVTGINYDNDPNAQTICKTPHADNTLGDYLEQHKIPLFTIAESEKYAHVTYFFNGGREAIRPDETRVIIPSDNPINFVESPAMKAPEITRALTHAVTNNTAEFYLVNYANADMVGHSGDLSATRAAVSILDHQLKQLCDLFMPLGGTLYITGDHGNAEDKSHHNPAHTTNPVYFLVVSEPPCDKKILSGMQTLADVKDVIIKNSFCRKIPLARGPQGAFGIFTYPNFHK
jgi:2,3-bisphosphoglycerate-independent phosphoglycerate mutase